MSSKQFENESKPGAEVTLAAILAEVVARRRRGEAPSAIEYAKRHPGLWEEIFSSFETMDLLEGRGALQPEDSYNSARQQSPQDESPALSSVLAGFPISVQRLIYLRHFGKRRWAEISVLLGRTEDELRRAYSRAIHELILETAGPKTE